MTDQLSSVFAALADPTRRDLVARLAAGDATVGELAAPYDVSVQAVSKHLQVLERAGLVTKGREAQRHAAMAAFNEGLNLRVKDGKPCAALARVRWAKKGLGGVVPGLDDSVEQELVNRCAATGPAGGKTS